MLPLRVPRLGARPLPTTSSPPLSSRWPISTPTLEDPMSIPTKYGSGFGISACSPVCERFLCGSRRLDRRLDRWLDNDPAREAQVDRLEGGVPAPELGQERLEPMHFRDQVGTPHEEWKGQVPGVQPEVL